MAVQGKGYGHGCMAEWGVLGVAVMADCESRRNRQDFLIIRTWGKGGNGSGREWGEFLGDEGQDQAFRESQATPCLRLKGVSSSEGGSGKGAGPRRRGRPFDLADADALGTNIKGRMKVNGGGGNCWC